LGPFFSQESDVKTLNNTVVGLIQDLDHEYPAQCIGRSQPETEAQRYAGKRELIDHLIERLAVDEQKAGQTNVFKP
jgi:hypothetical protein